MDPATCRAIARAVGLDADRVGFRAVRGGDIADSYRIEDGRRAVFVKCLARAQCDVLDAERDGLARIAETGSLRVPGVLASGCDESAWLALEYLDFGRADDGALTALGERLAGLHAHRGERFGLARDNYIGTTPQLNEPTTDWTEFFFEYRIGYQIDRLSERGEDFGRGDVERLRGVWTRRFPGYDPAPSLIHGDLWLGNAAVLADGEPVVFDPAVHYADRECDLAMARLFGGFGDPFHNAYARVAPLAEGWRERLRFYQLYHLLNHANLFGGAYIASCRKLVDDLSASRAAHTG